MYDTIIAALIPHIVEMVSLALTVILGFVAMRFKTWTGLEIEERHRKALHMAIMSGVRAALERGDTPEQAMAAGVNHAKTSSPDAMEYLKASLKPGVIQTIAKAKVNEALSELRSDKR